MKDLRRGVSTLNLKASSGQELEDKGTEVESQKSACHPCCNTATTGSWPRRLCAFLPWASLGMGNGSSVAATPRGGSEGQDYSNLQGPKDLHELLGVLSKAFPGQPGTAGAVQQPEQRACPACSHPS